MEEPDYITRQRDELKRRAVEFGLEVVTPAAATALFGKSEPTVRGAAREGRIETEFTVHFSEKAVRLYSLASCIKCWGEPPAASLEFMRENGHVMYVSNADGMGGGSFLVLHPEPLVTLKESAE